MKDSPNLDLLRSIAVMLPALAFLVYHGIEKRGMRIGARILERAAARQHAPAGRAGFTTR